MPPPRSPIGALFVQTLLVLLALAAGAYGLEQGLDGALTQAGGAPKGLEGPLREALSSSRISLSVALLAPLLALWLRRPAMGSTVLLPAAAALLGLGATLRAGYARPWRALEANDARCLVKATEGCLALDFGALGFTQGAAIGGVLAALLILSPGLPRALERGARLALLLTPIVLLLLLAAFGEAPQGSDARINLFGVQPIELAKLSFALALGLALGEQAEKLQAQRRKLWGLVLPRVELLLPAFVLLLALFSLLFALGDLGPTLILGLVFLALLVVGTGAWSELLASLMLVGALGLGLVLGPRAWLPGRVQTRLDMWLEPWRNGMPDGDQLARGLWAIAAGGAQGQGAGRAHFGVVWAGNNDLALANLAESFGALGVGAYLLLLLLLVAQGLAIGARSRSPGRALMAVGVSSLFAAQLLIIGSGTLGLLPLTGVVVPFLSEGRSSMVVFFLALGALLRLAAEGPRVGDERRLLVIQGGVLRLALVTLVLFGVIAGGFFAKGVVQGRRWSAEPILVTGGDGTVFLKSNPRLVAMTRRLPPGQVLDREGVVLRGTNSQGQRTWPMGAALGTLLGRKLEGDAPGEDWPIPPEPWSIEAQHAQRLRGYPDLPQPLTVWVQRETTTKGTSSRVLAAGIGELPAPTAREPGATVSRVSLARPDLSEFAGLLARGHAARERELQTLIADIPGRSVQLTLDARLQKAAYAALADVVPRYGKGGAAVVIAVDTGQVLARAQFPDLDLSRYEGSQTYQLRLAGGRAEDSWTQAQRRFFGPYGPWRNKTGAGGVQAGSIFKLLTALAWARGEPRTTGQACETHSVPSYRCEALDGRPGFKAKGWRKAIHDSHKSPDGDVEISEGLEVSCNVYFAQLGLSLGAQAFTGLAEAGLSLDSGNFVHNLESQMAQAGDFALAQTAFGQGAARMSPLEAAQLIATVASGGVLRRCPLELGGTCETHVLVDDPDALRALLSGLKKVVDSGTLRKVKALEGVRLYGKTGTADDPGRREEEPWGIRRGSSSERPHSWVVMFAEPNPRGGSACSPTGSGRIAVAALVDRGGAGSGAAQEVAMRIFESAVQSGYLGP